jgi:uncharacterized membrane protein HdeD (DUF308 family)
MAQLTIETGPQEAVRKGKWFLALGVVLIALGAVGLGGTVLPVLLTTLVLGPLLLASGVLQVFLAFVADRTRGFSLHLLTGALDLVIGFLVMARPSAAVADLMLLLAVFLMVGGLQRIFGSLLTRPPAWGWMLAAGVAGLLLGICLWQHWPFRGLGLLGLCLGIDFVFNGATWVIFSQVFRGSPELPSAARPEEPQILTPTGSSS